MLSFLSLLLVPAVLAHNISHAGPHSPRGGKRFSNYYAGADEGACGGWHQDSEFVVALTTLEFDGGSNCNKEVYITYNGISAVAKIVDECMGCPWDGLDFSQSLFGHFVGGEQNNENVGIIYGDWVYGTGPSNGGGDGGGDDTTTTTKKAAPSHTTTTTSTTSTTHSSTHTTTSTTTTSSKSASASASIKSVSTTSSASASTTAAPTTGPENLHDFSQAMLNLAGLVVQAPHAA